MKPIFIYNLSKRFLYLNLRDFCWRMKEESDELDIKVSMNKRDLVISICSASSGDKIGYVIVSKAKDARIVLDLEFMMKIFVQNGGAVLRPVPCRVAAQTDQVLLQPESCVREIWLMFERTMWTLAQFEFSSSLILMANDDDSLPPVIIVLFSYFSTPRAFPVLTFQSFGRTWRIKRAI